MNYEIIHFIPFDMGYSFFDYGTKTKQSSKDFIVKVEKACKKINATFCQGTNNQIGSITLNNIECILLNYGVGIFVTKKPITSDCQEADLYFKDIPAAQIYYHKKQEQKDILKGTSSISKDITFIIDAVWSSIDVKERAFSSNHQYKSNGLSYVLSLYSLKDKYDSVTIDFLMDPGLMHDIQDDSKWDFIRSSMASVPSKTYNSEPYGEKTKVIASWSAVAVLNGDESALSKIIDYEINLQAAWFLYDCMIDNLKHENLSAVELQNYKSIYTGVNLEVDNIISANMSTCDINFMNLIKDTSGIELIKQKLDLLLNNKIALENAKSAEKQKVYGIITEILLVIFTLVSIYEPILNVINRKISHNDIIELNVMGIALAISSFFIIRKEKS